MVLATMTLWEALLGYEAPHFAWENGKPFHSTTNYDDKVITKSSGNNI